MGFGRADTPYTGGRQSGERIGNHMPACQSDFQAHVFVSETSSNVEPAAPRSSMYFRRENQPAQSMP